MRNPTDSCLQLKLNAYCQFLVKEGQCANFDYARYDTGASKWRCYETLDTATGKHCVDPTGTRIECEKYADDSAKCTSNQPMLDIIANGCDESTTTSTTTTAR